ncbi:MAG: PPOX class F420-dependent oxidoreductase [Microthrixaceae bacterium]
MNIGEEKYVSITTLTAKGAEKRTPVWIAELADGRVGFTTAADSWKVRRIRRNPSVRLQPCDMRGRVNAGSAPVAGTAEIAPEDSEGYLEVRRAIDSKYGIAAKAIALQAKLGSLLRRTTPPRCAVVVRLG